MSFLPLLGAGLGLIGSIIGSNAQNHAADQASQAAQQGSAAETQLINQGELPILNDLMSSWNQFYAPLQGGNAEVLGALSDLSHSMPDLGALMNLASIDPSMRDAFSGIPLQGLTNNLLQYDSNPGDTLSGLGGVGGDALAGLLGPSVLSGVSPGAMGFFGNEAMNGLSPATMAASLDPYDTGVQQQINSMRNSLGSATPNIAGLAEDMNLQGLQGRVGLLGNLAGQNQMFQNQGMQSLLGTAGTLDQQTMDRLAAAMQTAGGIDALTQNMLNNAYNIGNQQSGLGMNYLGQDLNTQQGLFGDVQNYLSQGRDMLPGIASGFQNIAGLYGNAAGQAANNAMQIGMNASNPFSSLGAIFANNPGMFNFGGGGGGNQFSGATNAIINGVASNPSIWG